MAPDEREEDELLQAKAQGGQARSVTPQTEANINAMRGKGTPLPPSARAFFEPRFGHDFSGVRIHSDAKATEAAQAVSAKAFTVGRDIVFGQGHYAPQTSDGKHLLGHELVHVVQQAATSVSGVPTRNIVESGAHGLMLQREENETKGSTLVRAPLCPKVPTETPATCSLRHDAYCEAKKCQPLNNWLSCVCTASGEVCEAVDAFSFKGWNGFWLQKCIFGSGNEKATKEKSEWFDKTNKDIWGHWRKAFDALHDNGEAIPSEITAEWKDAVTKCRIHGLASSDCCEAQVKAEQKAIEKSDAYVSEKFGPLPTDVPGSTWCSNRVASSAPEPAFIGDFSKTDDRIKYGKLRCCK